MKKTLHILHNEQAVDMSIAEIFDTNRFDTFQGVTFSVSPKFMNTYLEGFKTVQLVVGIPERHVQRAANEAATHLKSKIEGILNNEPAEWYQSLSTPLKAKLSDKAVQLLVPVGCVIHSKFYLLRHSQTGETRVIMGSANLSDQAFHAGSNQYESILILDNHPIYDAYATYYESDLLPVLVDYLPQELLKINEKKVKTMSSDTEQFVDEVILLNNTELQRIKEKGVMQTLAETDQKVALGVLPVTIKEEMRNILDNRQQEERDRRRAQQTEAVAFTIVKEAISPRSKVPAIKKPDAIKEMVKKKVKVTVKVAEESGLAERPLLVNVPEQRNLSKGLTGLFTPSASNKDRLIPFGKRATPEEIRASLEHINALLKTFETYTVRYDDTYGARVMEALFYFFTASQLFEVKRKARSEEERNDIPQFLFLGGTAGSGKSSLLKAFAKMIQAPHIMDYNSIVLTGNRRKSETITALEGWMGEQNVTPLLIDEVPEIFYSKPEYGNELIVNITNRMVSNPHAFPVMVGTTNADGYTLEERARRRSYYLKLDKVFDDMFRQESQPAYNAVYASLDDTLYLDFVVRLSERLSDDSLDWAHFENGGKIDFLYHTRQIFKDYYEETKMPIPRYFPMGRYDDSKETNQEKWRKLFLGTSMADFKFDDYTGNLLFKTATLDDNLSRFGGSKPSDIYKNALSPKVLVGSKDSADIELDTKLFFEWIEVENPYAVAYKKHLKAFFTVNRSLYPLNNQTGCFVINMNDVYPESQAGVVEQYRHYMPADSIESEGPKNVLTVHSQAFCEWLGVPVKAPSFLTKLFSLNA